jgi:hypothetical protein
MRALLLAVLISVPTLCPSTGKAGDRLRQITVRGSEMPQRADRNKETYRGYYIDLSQIGERQNIEAIENALRHQIDIVESVGLPSALKFFHTVPIASDDMACLDRSPDYPAGGPVPIACFGHEYNPAPHLGSLHPSARKPSGFTVWDSDKFQWTNPNPLDLALDTGRGLVMIRPLVLPGETPIMLHEFLHAYHADVIPEGFQNPDIIFYHKRAKSGNLYPPDAYLLTNEKEFFSVTASVFLYGEAGQFTRADLKRIQPDYYEYLSRLFEFDPASVPVASRPSPNHQTAQAE